MPEKNKKLQIRETVRKENSQATKDNKH